MKRALDLLVSIALLVLLALPLCAIGLVILLKQGRPILFRQTRVGRHGTPFSILKFRTMQVASRLTAAVTSGEDDPRITPTGRWLRRHRLDEFPQLLNVLLGHMSLVGPRPEVPNYVDLDDPLWRNALSVRPGITGPDSLAFRDEGQYLSEAADADAAYRDVILPKKLQIQSDYADQRSLLGDLRILFRTFGALRG